MNLLVLFLKHLRVLAKGRWLALASYTGLIVVISLFEGLSLGLLYPLVDVVLDEQKKMFYVEKVRSVFGLQFDPAYFTTIFLISVLIVFLIKNFLVIVGTYGQYYLTQMMRVDWQMKIFRNYLKRKYEFFINSKTGDLIQKQMVHTMTSENAMLFTCGLARDVLASVGILFVLVFVSWQGGVITLVVVVVSLCVFTWISKNRIYVESRIVADLQQEAYSLAVDAINGMKEIKLFSAEDFFSNKFHSAILGQARIYIRNATLGMCPPPIMQIAAIVIIVGILLFVSVSGMNALALLPIFVVFGGGLHRLIRLSAAVNSGIMQVARALPSIEIVSQMLVMAEDDCLTRPRLAQETMPSKEQANVLKEGAQIPFLDCLQIKDVTFSYPNTERQQLSDLNVCFKKGKFYGVVGPSGCGKTTLVDIMIGLHSLQKGDILIDGKSFYHYTMKSWRKLFGYVSQNPFIFSGTIAANIAFAVEDNNIDYQRVEYAAKTAGLESVLDRLEDKYQTFVGEKGHKLSGGERQRLSIARTIYLDPQIYIFDEATSALDSESEKGIQKSIEALSSEKKTVIAIAHRLSTIVNADELIVMEKGRIIEVGTHEELLRKNGSYARYYRTQYEIF